MATEIEKLRDAAEKLVAQAQTDAAVAARLEKNAAQEISSAAGCPMLAGVEVSCLREGEKLALKVDFNGELDDKVLDAVAGGKQKETAQSQRASGRGHTTYLGPG